MGPRRTLFLVFLRIGGGMIGGGYSMLPLIQREVEQRWQDKLVFSEALPLAQALPGPVAVNIASIIGRAVAGFGGACSALAGVILPSILILGLLAASTLDWNSAPLIAAAMYGLRPVAIGLIASSLWRLRNTWTGGVFRPIVAGLTLILLASGLIPPMVLILIAVIAAGWHAWRTRKCA